jgi:hypothetical protein
MNDDFEHIFQIKRGDQVLSGTKAELEERLSELDRHEALEAERRENARRDATHGPINWLLRRSGELYKLYVESWERYLEAEGEQRLRHLDQANEYLESANEALVEVLERPREALKENPAVMAVANALKDRDER